MSNKVENDIFDSSGRPEGSLTNPETGGPKTEGFGHVTKGVSNMLGDPKKAMVKISIPMMIALLFEAIYNMVDTLWVAGLGAEALAAVGLAFPFFMVLTAVSTGIGTGAGSAISRAIGSKNKGQADSIATHALIFAVIFGLLCLLGVPLMEPLFLLMGSEASLAALAAEYMNVLIFFAVIIFILNIGISILNSEGNSKKSMIATIIGAVLNIILDPIFIYDFGFGMGVQGAAVATGISMTVSALMILYWIFRSKDTFVSVTFRKFKFKLSIIREILVVGIPAAFSQLAMSISSIFLNSIVLHVGGTDGAAIYSTGWRILSMGIMPLLGLATGLTTMSGVSYGSYDISKLKSVYRFALKFGIALEFIIAAVVFLFADPISGVFATGDSAYLHADIADFLQIMAIFFMMVPANILTGAMLQGLRRGKASLVLTLFRVIVFEVPLAYLLGISLGIGLIGVWIGILAGDFIAMVLSFAFGEYIIRKLKKLYPTPTVKTVP